MQEKIRIDSKTINEFVNIIEEKAIYAVFQPIVSLTTGEVKGYEALSRIDNTHSRFSIAELFEIAEETGSVWILEKLCRKKALKAAAVKPEKTKLFLNVDGNILQDSTFIKGFTNKKAAKHGVKSSEIVFEITERSDIENYKILQEVIKHYADQGYEIALDDVGAGYSGLNRVVNTNPQYLKADMELVRNIHTNKAKKKMMKLLLEYCKEMEYILIAEGIENVEELKCLIEIGVPYGQGYFLGKPDRRFKDIEPKAKAIINNSEI